jgi:hypothetical protein
MMVCSANGVDPQHKETISSMAPGPGMLLSVSCSRVASIVSKLMAAAMLK